MNLFTFKFLILISFLITITSCSTPKKSDRQATYFGGEIINPNTNYVVLSKGYDFRDTIFLDDNNRFIYKIDSLQDGLYSFKHNPESQVVILEKGDSILIRLNTIEFDESLVFTGDGARKNNFLIDTYLQNEKERQQLRRVGFKLSPPYFKNQQDSLLNVKLSSFEKLTKKNSLSNLSKKITQASFVYDYYTRHEMYFNIKHDIKGKNAVRDIVSSPFFNYRNLINFNDNDIKRLYSYNRFLNFYFANIPLSNQITENREFETHFDKTLYKINLIDSLIQHSFIKDNLLRRVTSNFLLNSENNLESNKILKRYLLINSDKKSQKELKELAGLISKLRPNNIIPDQDLITSKGETIKLSSLFNQPITALYFWSMESKKHYERAHNKVQYLKSLHPNIDFIAINTDDEQTKNWLKTIKRHHYNLDYEYEFKNSKHASEELLIYYRNKVILVNQEGKIINSKADLFASSFEKQLLYYTTQLTRIAEQ
ncbi:thioredoxin-like domain-containing protein [Aquimarina algicola]|uniref:Thioredoxin-like fold domain-containing protein n=1 Tax=Aquimarina algicola TaxID=2589995 RepID=A0A504J428_9FLAO|nr:thioredoxin-like domain-containing protein [Aquimarina algicola]TPN82343.1 hypothetical protein FHK87_23250 [Aquimarina algicola]